MKKLKLEKFQKNKIENQKFVKGGTIYQTSKTRGGVKTDRLDDTTNVSGGGDLDSN